MSLTTPRSATAEPSRFSIRLPRPLWMGLIASVLIVAAATLSYIIPNYWQRAAIRMVEDVGGKVRIRAGGPVWLRRCVSDERMAYFDEAYFASLYSSSIRAGQFSFLNRLIHLEKLILLGTPVTDDDLRHIGQITQLRILDLEGTQVTDDGLWHLAGLGHLESLDLSRTDVSDDGLSHLASLQRLKQLRLYGTDVTDAGVATLKRALPGLEVWTSPISDLEQVFYEPPLERFFAPQPWHSWKAILEGQPRVVRFDGAHLFTIPGSSSAEVHLFKEDGTELAKWFFSTGWRIDLEDATFEAIPQFSDPVLVVRTRPSINGRDVARQFFAFSGDRLRFVRLEDDAAAILQNNYRAPNQTLGIIPEGKGLDDWIALLESQNNADALAALTFIGGEHLNPTGADVSWHHEEIEQAKLAEMLRQSPRIQAAVSQLKRADHKWLQEAADLAATESERHRAK